MIVARFLGLLATARQSLAVAIPKGLGLVGLLGLGHGKGDPKTDENVEDGRDVGQW